MMTPSVAVAALLASLVDDPFYQAITIDFAQDAEVRSRALTAYFVLSLEEARQTGRCVTLDGAAAVGAAAWLLPREPDLEARVAAAKAAALARILGPRGNENYHRIVDFMTARAEQIVSAEAWYLSIVGVAPSAQGRGVGARLIAPTLLEADAAIERAAPVPFEHRADPGRPGRQAARSAKQHRSDRDRRGAADQNSASCRSASVASAGFCWRADGRGSQSRSGGN